MNRIRQSVEAYIAQYVTPALRDAAREDLHALLNRIAMASRRDEIERAAPREGARR